MRAPVYRRTRSAWIGSLLLGLVLWSPGLASAQLDKQEQKCANSINKGAAKVAKAQAGDNSACIKDFGKGKIESAEDCIISDPKGKVAKAISKIKTSDCSGGAAPSFLPGLQTSSSAIGDIMKDKDLKLIHSIFGANLDASIVKAAGEGGDKPGAGCQAAIAKAAGKCQDAKLASFNSCKKDKLKAGDTDIQACMGTGTSGIPDGKGKISKKCGNGLGGTVGKKCAGTDNDVLFLGCTDSGEDLGDCLDRKIECEVCRALNGLDGVTRDCDLFDDGLDNNSCPNLVCTLSENKVCVGGDKNGQACVDTLEHSDCPPGPGGGARCIQDTHFLIETLSLAGDQGTLFSIPVGGDLGFDCTAPDPNTGLGSCTCDLLNPKNFEIGPIGFICLSTFSGCDPVGQIDCNGGTGQDLDTLGSHNVAFEANTLDSVQFPAPFCGLLDPDCVVPGNANCDAHDECAAMCDTFCADQPGNFARFDSGCEGFCEFGPNDNLPCTLDADCPGGQCHGVDPVTHESQCNCTCLEIDGAPAPAGAVRCTLGVSVNVESAEPCDSLDITTTIGEQCVPVTTQDSTALLLKGNANDAFSVLGPLRSGSPVSCPDFFANNLTGMVLSGNQTFFDSDVGDLISPETYVCE